MFSNKYLQAQLYKYRFIIIVLYYVLLFTSKQGSLIYKI